MLYMVTKYAKTRRRGLDNVHFFDVQSLEGNVQRTLVIQGHRGSRIETTIVEKVTQEIPFFTAEEEDFKNDTLKIRLGMLRDYGFAPLPEQSYPQRPEPLSRTSEIHAVGVYAGHFSGKRFMKKEDDELEGVVIDKYNLPDCSDRNQYTAFLEKQGVKVLKEGKNYRVIEVDEGQFKIEFMS